MWMPPAARVTDLHTCPEFDGPVPHVGGPLLPIGSSPNVFINGLPAVIVGTMATCVGPPDSIAIGSTGIFINGRPAARLGDMTVHGGVIVSGSPNVIFGEIGAGAPGTAGMGAVVIGAAVAGTGASQTPNPSVLSIPAECAYLKKNFRVQGSKPQFNAGRKSQTLSSPKQRSSLFQEIHPPKRQPSRLLRLMVTRSMSYKRIGLQRRAAQCCHLQARLQVRSALFRVSS